MDFKEVTLVKDIVVNGLPLEEEKVVIRKGETVDAVKVSSNVYKVFHRTGWWAIPAEYIEGEEK